jgi:Cu/Ag efflux protein CusF
MRNLCIGIVVVLAIVVGAAWWLNWWSVSPNNDDGKSGVQLTLDKDKIRHDVEAAEQKIKNGAEALNGGRHDKEPAAPGQSVEGTIRTIDPGTHLLTVMSDKNAEVTVLMEAVTKIRVGSRAGTLADLKIGDRATITFESDKGEKVARSVSVEKES